MRPFIFTPPAELQQAHNDLCYLFQSSNVFCGISSNYQALKQAIITKSSSNQCNIQILDCPDNQIPEVILRNKINKARYIGNKFNQLTSKQKHIAQLFFYEQQFEPTLENYFGMGIKLIPKTKSYDKLPNKFKCLHKIHLALKSNAELIEHIKIEVQNLYLSVLESYEKT